MQLLDEWWLVTVTKARSKETFTGVAHNDGLQSLWYVTLPTGEQRIATVLDAVTFKKQLTKEEAKCQCSTSAR